MESWSRRILRLLHGIVIGWLIALSDLLASLHEQRRRKERQRRERDIYTRCQPIPPEVYKRPDPLIYCQQYLMSLGLGVTWDNPDIQLYEVDAAGNRGAAVNSHALRPDQTYEIEATIYNGSTVAPAVGMPVEFSFLSFGIGTASHGIGTVTVDLPVKGAAGHPARAVMPWRTPPARGHYCIQVKLVWADDANPANNLGQENVEVGVPASPAVYRIAVGNRTEARRVVRFEGDAYTLAEPPPCDPDFDPATFGHQRGRVLTEDERAARQALMARRTRRHTRGLHPVPDGWRVGFDPERVALGPDEEAELVVHIEPPEQWSGRQAINVNGFDDAGRLIGGVTLYTERR